MVFLSADMTPVTAAAVPPVGVKLAVTRSAAPMLMLNEPFVFRIPEVVAVVRVAGVSVLDATGFTLTGVKPFFQSLINGAERTDPDAAAGTDCWGLLRSSKLNNLLTPPLI